MKTTILKLRESVQDPRLAIANEIIAALRSSGDVHGNVRSASVEGKCVYAGIRNWGRWTVPVGEEDDGDYDWEELTDSSARKADGIVKAIASKHPKFKVEWTQGEKNWIDIIVM